MVQKLLFEHEPMFNGKKELLFTTTVSLFTQIACRPTIAIIQSCLSLHPLELRTCMSNLSMNKFWIIEKSIFLNYIGMQGGPVMWRERIWIKLIDCNMFLSVSKFWSAEKNVEKISAPLSDSELKRRSNSRWP